MHKLIGKMLRKKSVRKNKVLVLLDFDNLYLNLPEKTITETLDRALKQITEEVGPISKVFVFVPYYSAIPFGEDFYRAGFITILCPRIKTKDGQTEINTTDGILTEIGKELINDMPDITHLCLGSGDVDFSSGDIGFLSLLKKATRYGLDIAIIASDLASLNPKLIEMIDKKPNSKEKMLYILSHQKKEG